jgi:hypothetical protein
MKRKITLALAALLAIASLSACDQSTDAPSATQKDQASSAQILAKLQTAQPAPQFDWSQIRQTLIDAETAQAQATQTTTFFFNQGVTDPVYVCPSIGFPVPGTDEITNPNQINYDQGQYGGGNTVISQIDPNGVFGGSTSATLVICVSPQGKPELHHAEEFAHAIAGPATWDYVHHRIQITGTPTFAPKVGK